MSRPIPEWFAVKFKLQDLEIKKFKHWTWSLRPSQCTLGASILSLNRESISWGTVTSEENAELSQAISEIENCLSSAFGYEKINYLMLMMVDSHVHFHVIPRYSEDRSMFGHQWQDLNWPKPPDLLAGLEEKDILQQIISFITLHLHRV
jgi:diadenosine tetraphosphate (Ap4A) HIT family hydrolase